MMSIFQKNYFPLCVNFVVGFFFLSILSIKGGYNISPVLLMLMGMGYCLYTLINKIHWNLSREDKWLIYSCLFYFSVFILSMLLNQGKARELDNPSRVLLLIPALIFLLQTKIRFKTLLLSIPCGAIVAALTALYDRFILHAEIAFSPRIMHIQAGDMSMSLGMFSLVLGIYFIQKKQPKLTALYMIAALLGMFGSILSTARGGWVGVPVVIAVIFFVYRNSLSKKFFTSFIALFVLAVATVTLMPNSRVMERISQAKNDIQVYVNQDNGNTSLGARFEMWRSALIMTAEKPILGWGIQGATEQRNTHVKQGIVSSMTGEFTHAHNQYLDDLSKRGIIGLLAFLGILLVPLRSFIHGMKCAVSDETKAIATLGVVHIVSVLCYCVSQGFFTHNSGNLFYFFLVVVFYAAMKSRLKAEI